jgi:hypothetical protein
VSETWFKTRVSSYSLEAKITPIEVDRSTDKSVYIGGRKSAKSTTYDQLHPTWQAAHQFLMETAERRLLAARNALAREQGMHGNVKGMKEPT